MDYRVTSIHNEAKGKQKKNRKIEQSLQTKGGRRKKGEKETHYCVLLAFQIKFRESVI